MDYENYSKSRTCTCHNEGKRLYKGFIPAYKRFSKYFPNKESDMRRALEYAITPTTDTNVLLLFLNEFGAWMVSEADKWLQFYNPTRELNMKIV